MATQPPKQANSRANVPQGVRIQSERTPLLDDNNRRQLQGQALVILARTGQRVQRSYSQFSLGFESFLFRSDDAIEAMEANSNNLAFQGRWIGPIADYLSSDQFIQVLKCAIAYMIASLAVYWRAFDDFLGESDSKHLVATVAVYFHPLRSSGSMIQSLGFVVILMLFSCIVTFSCLALLGYFFNAGEDELCYAIDIVVSLAALGAVAFMKQRVNKPTFNTACLLALISLVACLVKEGAVNASEIPVDRVVLTLTCVAVGCAISVICCFVLGPARAVSQLRAHLNDLFNILSALLLITANRFLNGENLLAKDIDWFNRLNKSISHLNKDLEECTYELTLKGRRGALEVFLKLVSNTQSLARHIQAIRSSVEMQWALLHEELNDLHSSVA